MKKQWQLPFLQKKNSNVIFEEASLKSKLHFFGFQSTVNCQLRKGKYYDVLLGTAFAIHKCSFPKKSKGLMKSEFNLGFIKGREIENYTLIKVLSIPYTRYLLPTCLVDILTIYSIEDVSQVSNICSFLIRMLQVLGGSNSTTSASLFYARICQALDSAPAWG